MTRPESGVLRDSLANSMTNSANDSWRSLSSLAELIEPRARSRVDFIAECRSGALNDVLAIYRTFESVEITGRFDEDLVESLPTSVKFICHNGEE
jgi:glyoxylate reductase